MQVLASVARCRLTPRAVIISSARNSAICDQCSDAAFRTRILKAGAPGVRNVVVGANGQTAETAAHLKTPPAIRRV